MRTHNDELNYVRELSRGNCEAYDHLFMHYYPKVNYFIARLVKSPEVAKDLSQDIFFKIWTNREQMADVESFNAYIFRVARNAALNYLKHNEIMLRYKHRQQMHEGKESIEENIDMKDLELAIWSVVEGMPAQRKRVFKLSREQYLKNREIMDVLNISEKTVKNHLTYALNAIKKAIFLMVTLFYHSVSTV